MLWKRKFVRHKRRELANQAQRRQRERNFLDEAILNIQK